MAQTPGLTTLTRQPGERRRRLTECGTPHMDTITGAQEGAADTRCLVVPKGRHAHSGRST